MVYGPERLKPAIYSASPVLADGKIYVTSEEGYSVFRAGPKFELLAENPAGYTLSTIAVSKGQLFLRTEKTSTLSAKETEIGSLA